MTSPPSWCSCCRETDACAGRARGRGEARISWEFASSRPGRMKRKDSALSRSRITGPLKTACTALGALLVLSSCNEVAHPNLSKYEYLYSDGAFVQPYRSFPR